MDIHKCYTCSIGIYNMTTIVAILISFKDYLFPSLRQIESKQGQHGHSELLESFDSDIQFGSHGNYFDCFQKA